MRAMNEYTDMLKERLIVEFARHDRSGVYGYTQRKMSYNSNRIEGSTLTENRQHPYSIQEQLRVILTQSS